MMSKDIIKEACIETVDQAVRAESQGADQIELCDRLDLDGTSPPMERIIACLDQIAIPIKVMVNPYPYEYRYVGKKLDTVCFYIEQLQNLDIAGIVFGPITQYGLPDIHALEKIRSITDLPITYHKAIDDSPDLFSAIAIVRESKAVQYILSSGGASTALEGIDQLTTMHNSLVGSDIHMIAAGKITIDNINTLHSILELKYYHGKKIVGHLV